MIFIALSFSVLLVFVPALYCQADSQAEIEARLTHPALTAGGQAEPVKQNVKVEYSAESLRDPFKPEIKKADSSALEQEQGPSAQSPALNVQGLIWGGAFPQAIINNRVVREGDEIEGAKVIKIGKDGVSVLCGIDTFKLNPPEITQAQNPQNGILNLQGGSYD